MQELRHPPVPGQDERAATVGDQPAAPSLFDVLPGHVNSYAGNPDPAWQQREYPLPVRLLAAIAAKVGADPLDLASFAVAAMTLTEGG